jgi:hypothetical protein
VCRDCLDLFPDEHDRRHRAVGFFVIPVMDLYAEQSKLAEFVKTHLAPKGDEKHEKEPAPSSSSSPTVMALGDRSLLQWPRWSPDQRVPVYTPNDDDKKEMVALLHKLVTRQRERRKEGLPAGKPRKTIWRQQRPSAEIEMKWRCTPQNTEPWHKARSGDPEAKTEAEQQASMGASFVPSVLGYNPMATPRHLSLADRGREAWGERSIDDCFPLDEGHANEDEARKITAILTGGSRVTIHETGLWLDPENPGLHASPDGLLDMNRDRDDWRIDTSRMELPWVTGDATPLWENKCTMFGLLSNKQFHRWGFPHTAKAAHVIQMQQQMRCLKSPLTLYTNYWHVNERSGMPPMGENLFTYDWSESDRRYQEVPPRERATITGRWYLAGVRTSVFWANAAFQAIVVREVQQYMDAVRADRDPTNHRQMDIDEPVTWVPLADAMFYVDGSPKELSQVKNILDPHILFRYATSSTRPRGWLGAWPFGVQCDVRTFGHVLPVRWRLSEFK